MVALDGSIAEDEERELTWVVPLHDLDGNAVKDSPGVLAADHRVPIRR